MSVCGVTGHNGRAHPGSTICYCHLVLSLVRVAAGMEPSNEHFNEVERREFPMKTVMSVSPHLVDPWVGG